MNSIHRRTLLAGLSASLLFSLAGCGGGKSEPAAQDVPRFVDPPTRGVGSFYWKTRLPGQNALPNNSFGPYGWNKTDENTLRVSATNDGTTTVYALNLQTGKILSQQSFPQGSAEALAAMGYGEPLPANVIKGAPPEITYNTEHQYVSRHDPVTKQVLWAFPSLDKLFTEFDQVGLPGAHPDGTLYLVTRDMAAKSAVRALDSATGETKWIGEGYLLVSDPYSYIGTSPILTSAGLLTVENGYADAGGPFVSARQSLTYLDPATGRITRKVPLFDSRGIWNVRVGDPVVGPDETVIGVYKDSVVAIRTK